MTRMRIRMNGDREPELGDVVFETLTDSIDGIELLERAFLVVGIEEPARGRTWGIVLERMDWTTALGGGGPTWCFYRDR